MTRLSVIVPGCNTPAKWWRRCIESVRAACGPEDEIIIVDDGSSVPVVKKWVFADEDQRVSLYRKANGGLSSARNFGMKLMSGKYVAFVDSDDQVKNDAFNRAINQLEKTQSDVCVYGVQTIWVDEGLTKVDNPGNGNFGFIAPEGVKKLLRDRVLNYAWNKVYVVDFIAGMRSARHRALTFEPDGMPCEDIIFNLECICAGARWCAVDYVGYIYYRCGMTLLSSYKPCNQKGLLLGSEAWRRYKEAMPGAKDVFGSFGEIDEAGLLKAEWTNLWKPGSPLGWRAKYKWLKANGSKMGVSSAAWIAMTKAAVFSFARRYLYFRQIRRWNIKRQYPHATEWKGVAK